MDGAENATQNNTWPPLEVTEYSLREWPNSNNKPLCEIDTTEEAASQDSNVTTPVAAFRTPLIQRNPSGSHALTNSADRNPFLIGYTQRGNTSKTSNEPSKNQSTQIEDNPLRYVFRTPPSRNLNICPGNIERSNYTPNSRVSAETAPDSTITKIQNESQAVREDFRNSLAQLSQVHSRLARENGEHAMRADVTMRDMDEMRKDLLEIQAEGRLNQGRLEASMAFLNDLIKQRENLADTRMAEMSAVMKERDRQANERMKLVSDLMQRRETDADTRMIDLMTTMKDLTLGVRAIASQTAAVQAKAAPMAPIASHMSDLPSTSTAPPPTQATYRKSKSGTTQHRASEIFKTDTPAIYKRDPRKPTKWQESSKPNHATLVQTH